MAVALGFRVRCAGNPGRVPNAVLKKLYRHRYVVEVFFHTLWSFRRIATRYKKTRGKHLAIFHFSRTLQWLHAEG